MSSYIDYWQIYERSIARVEGLARLLVLEKLTDTDTRYAFLESRRQLRGRPNPLGRYNRRMKRKFKGDLKADTIIGGLEMNDYDVQSLHIPYGPGWDARRIDKLVYQTVRSGRDLVQLTLLMDLFLQDLGMNCTYTSTYFSLSFFLFFDLPHSNFQSKEQESPPPPTPCLLWYYGRMFRGLLRGDRNAFFILYSISDLLI